MKNLKLFLTALLVFIISVVNAYPQSKPNSVYLELFGNGGLYSLNYDRLFTPAFGGRIGIMYLSNLDLIIYSFNDLFIIPATLNYFIGKGNSKLELGAGIILVSISGGEILGFQFDAGDSGTGIGGTATVGYRYQKPEGGFLFRIGFTPLISPEGVMPYAGISIGTSF